MSKFHNLIAATFNQPVVGSGLTDQRVQLVRSGDTIDFRNHSMDNLPRYTRLPGSNITPGRPNAVRLAGLAGPMETGTSPDPVDRGTKRAAVIKASVVAGTRAAAANAVANALAANAKLAQQAADLAAAEMNDLQLECNNGSKSACARLKSATDAAIKAQRVKDAAAAQLVKAAADAQAAADAKAKAKADADALARQNSGGGSSGGGSSGGGSSGGGASTGGGYSPDGSVPKDMTLVGGADAGGGVLSPKVVGASATGSNLPLIIGGVVVAGALVWWFNR